MKTKKEAIEEVVLKLNVIKDKLKDKPQWNKSIMLMAQGSALIAHLHIIVNQRTTNKQGE